MQVRATRPIRFLRSLTTACSVLACVACGEPPESSNAMPSAEGLAALADAQPRGTPAIGWRALHSLGVPAWLFYPSAPAGPDTMPSVARQALPDDYVTGLRRRFGPVAAATLAAARGNALLDAEMAKGGHPLLVFAPGAAMGGRDYRLFIEALAARGYAVAVLRPTGSPVASDQRYAEAADEIVAALEKLGEMAGRQDEEGRIDRAVPVLIGHSLGGAASALAATRTRACAVNIDGDFGGASETAAPIGPVLYVIGDPRLDRADDVARRTQVWRAVSARSGPGAMALGVAGMRHFDLADAASLPVGIIPPERRDGRFGSIGGAGARQVLVDLVDQFAEYCRRARSVPLSATLRLPSEAAPTLGR